MYCCVSTWYCICVYTCKYVVSTNSTLCKAAVYCNHSQWMLYQQSCTCTQSHSYCNGTANCTVGHHCEALLFLGQNAFNFVKKTTVPFHVPHGMQTKYIIFATWVPHKHQNIKHFFAEDICSPFCSTVCTYIHTCSNSVTVCEIPYCDMKKSTVGTQNWWTL